MKIEVSYMRAINFFACSEHIAVISTRRNRCDVKTFWREMRRALIALCTLTSSLFALHVRASTKRLWMHIYLSVTPVSSRWNYRDTAGIFSNYVIQTTKPIQLLLHVIPLPNIVTYFPAWRLCKISSDMPLWTALPSTLMGRVSPLEMRLRDGRRTSKESEVFEQ